MAASLVTAAEDRRKSGPNVDEDRLAVFINEWLAGREKQDCLFSVGYGHGNKVRAPADKITGRKNSSDLLLGNPITVRRAKEPRDVSSPSPWHHKPRFP